MSISDILEDYNFKLEQEEEFCTVFTSHQYERVDSQFISIQVVEEDYACLCGTHKYVYKYLEGDSL